MSVQQKKRKRPQAKDWPPMSKDKKYLDAYPRKMPRLLEAPYMDIWVTMMKMVKEEHRRRWVRAGIFRELHHELFTKVEKYTTETVGLLRPIKKLLACFRRGHADLEIFYTRTDKKTGQAVDLRWVVETAKTECLSWVSSSNNNLHHRTSCGHVGTRGPCLYTMRYLKEIDWMRFLDNYYQRGGRWDRRCAYCGIGHPLRKHIHHLKMSIRLAPKSMDRGKAMILAKTMLGFNS